MKAMIKDENKNHDRRKAKGNSSLFSLTHIILLVLSQVVIMLRLSTVQRRTFTLKSDQIHVASVPRLPVGSNLISLSLAGCSPGHVSHAHDRCQTV